jgi:hypothetical protein
MDTVAFHTTRWDNHTVKHPEVKRHPGPMRFLQVDAEFAGILIAVGFVVLGVASVPIAKWFLLAAVLLGGMIALLLRFINKG